MIARGSAGVLSGCGGAWAAHDVERAGAVAVSRIAEHMRRWQKVMKNMRLSVQMTSGTRCPVGSWSWCAAQALRRLSC